MERKRLSQAEKREATREDIVNAAARVFAERGFHGASLDAIGEEAGYSRGAVYYNFADKEELFLELLDRRCAERAQDLREVFVGDAEWRALYLEFLAHAARDAAFRRRFAKRSDEMRSALEELVVQRTGPFAAALGIEPEQLAVVIDALGTGLWAHHMLHGPRSVPPDLFSNALALLVEGIAARAGASAQALEV